MLQDLRTLAWHPMFLAVVASVLTLTGLERAINASNDKIIEVEMRTRHSDWGKTHWTLAEGSYASLSAQMSGSASNLAACECDRNLLDHCLEQLSAYDLPETILKKDGHTAMRSEFSKCIQLLRQRSKQVESHLRNCSRRADIQLTAVSEPSVIAIYHHAQVLQIPITYPSTFPKFLN